MRGERGGGEAEFAIGCIMKPYYDLNGIVIYHGDCRDVLPHLDIQDQPDLIVTDPPYGIQHSSSHGASWQNTQIAGDSDTLVRDHVIDSMLCKIAAAVFGTWKTPPIKDVRGVLVWDKGAAFGMGDLSFPWKPSFELIYVRGEGWKGSRDESVRRINGEVSWESRGRLHPHQKPIPLLQYLMRKSPEADLILDPFMGSGTTLRAAKDLGRRAIGIEIEERYCEIAAKRLAQGVLNFEDQV